jgi:hypothetical protein
MSIYEELREIDTADTIVTPLGISVFDYCALNCNR